jgi:TolA-binding protein
MKINTVYYLCLFILLGVMTQQSVDAAYVLKDGKFHDAKTVATMSVQKHYELGLQAFQNSQWAVAELQFQTVVLNFPKSSYANEAYFYLGVVQFNLDELDFSNEAFSKYLQLKNNPKHFQEAIEYKFQIAEKFADGSKRRFLGTKRLPKWASGRSLAIKIYDEVVAALPSNDLAARALYSKGSLYWQLKDYRSAIDHYQLVIRRFSKHELAPESFVAISKIYIDQSEYELQNPDLLTFAEINLRKFKQEFPREERLAEVEQDLLNLKEIYAQGLFNTARFYERTDKPRASIIYYQNVIKQFPDSNAAKESKERLSRFKLNS